MKRWKRYQIKGDRWKQLKKEVTRGTAGHNRPEQVDEYDQSGWNEWRTQHQSNIGEWDEGCVIIPYFMGDTQTQVYECISV